MFSKFYVPGHIKIWKLKHMIFNGFFKDTPSWNTGTLQSFPDNGMLMLNRNDGSFAFCLQRYVVLYSVTLNKLFQIIFFFCTEDKERDFIQSKYALDV